MRATLTIVASGAALASVLLLLATPARLQRPGSLSPHVVPRGMGRDAPQDVRRDMPRDVPRDMRRDLRRDLRRARRRRSAAVLSGAAALVSAVAVSSLPGTLLAVLIVAAGATCIGSWLVRRAAAEKQAEARRGAVADYCEALLGELQAGQPVAIAVDKAVVAWPAAHPVASASRLGADVPTALRRLGAEPGAEALGRLAATWELCADTGAGLAAGVARLLETTRVEQSLRRQVRGEIASARATAWLVALLPAVVLVAAQGLGGQPWRFLLQTPVGVGCLAAGVSLAAAGLLWIDRIAHRAVQGG